MSIWSAFFQGLIQGLTEFLPVSSSGHLSVFQYLTGGGEGGSLFFTVMLHLGTLAAVIAAYYEDLWGMLKEVGRIFKEIFTGKFTMKNQNDDRRLLFMLIVACVPMLLVLPVQKFAAGLAEDNDIVVEGVCFLVTSALLFLAVRARKGKAGIQRMKVRHAGIIGVAQGVAAVFPGISRSGATISTGMMLGFDRAFVVKFSFLLSIPAIIGGAAVEIGDVMEAGSDVAFWPLFIGMLTAALVGYGAIRLIRWLVLTDRFVIFAWYTLVVGVIVIILGIVGHVLGWGAGADASASGVSAAAVAVRGLLKG